MATIDKIERKSGTSYSVKFTINRIRKTLSLGSKYSARQVELIKMHVEELAEAIETGGKPGKSTLGFLEDMTDELKKRFEAVGLLEESKTITNKELFERFVEEKLGFRKKATLNVYFYAYKAFSSFFSEGGNPADVTKSDCIRWSESLSKRGKKNGKGFSEASRSVHLAKMQTVFQWAVENEILESNPLKGLCKGSMVNRKRDYFITMSDYQKLLDACPCQNWRTLIALCRLGGLRHDSETKILKWSDVDFHAGTVLVHSPKTEHHSGQEARIIPMSPELRTELESQFELAEEGGSPYVINREIGNTATQWRKLGEIIERAGLTVWERRFQNLRESLANEIWSICPPHVSAAIMGHSLQTAQKHYLRVRQDDYWFQQMKTKGTGGIISPKEPTTNTDTIAAAIWS